MTLRKARQILESEDVVSMEYIAEALVVLAKKERKKKTPSDPANSHKAYHAWRRRNKETTELRDEIRKYWPQKTP